MIVPQLPLYEMSRIQPIDFVALILWFVIVLPIIMYLYKVKKKFIYTPGDVTIISILFLMAMECIFLYVTPVRW